MLEKERLKNHYYDEEFFGKDPFDLVVVHLKDYYQIGMHTHQFYEINIVTDGTGCHYIEQMRFPLRKGDVFVIPPGISHGYYCDSRLDVCHILINKQFLKQYREELESTPGYQALFETEPYLRQLSKEQFFLRLGQEDLFEVRKEIVKIIQAGKDTFRPYQCVLTLGLLCDLCLKMNRQYHDLRKTSNSNYCLLRVAEYIQSHLEEKLMIPQLADMAAMSVSTFNRQFKSLFHQTPGEFILKNRIIKAEEFLEEQSLSKSEIAQICGFYDISHMDKYIK